MQAVLQVLVIHDGSDALASRPRDEVPVTYINVPTVSVHVNCWCLLTFVRMCLRVSVFVCLHGCVSA